MNDAAALTFAAAVPFLLLGLLLWLARLEETLGDGLDSPRIASEPAPAALAVDAAAVPSVPVQARAAVPTPVPTTAPAQPATAGV